MFMDGSASLGSSRLANGAAIKDTSILPAGNHSITASFVGATTVFNNAPIVLSPSTSAVAQITISGAPTTTTITSSTSTSTAGSVVSFIAKVTSTSGAPFGGVTFLDGMRALGSISLTGAQVVFSTASLATGSHTITAVFNANDIFASSTSGESAVKVQTAQGLKPTMAIVQADTSAGGTAQLTATVSPASTGGQVVFLGDGAILGAAPLNGNGIANLSGLNVAGAIHNFTASVAPSSNYAPTASPMSQDGWLGAAPEFTLALDTQSVVVTTRQPATLHLGAAAAGAASGEVTIACFMPDYGYECSAAAAQIAFGGSTTLSISQKVTSSNAAMARLSLACLGPCVLLIFRRRRRLGVLIASATLAIFSISGCGPVHSSAMIPAVVRVEAKSINSGTTIRSLEMFVSLYVDSQ